MTFPAYPDYRDSGVEWLGAVPTHWESWKISHAYGELGSGTTPPTSEAEWYEGGTVPWVTTGELRESVILETKKLLSSNAISTFSALRLHPAGSLAIAMYGATIGRLGILGIDATTNQACCLLTRPNHLHVKFTFYWLLAFKQNIIDLYASGGGQPNINQEIIANLKIPAPGVREQIQIARFLDHETARIDALIEEQQRLIELLKEKRQAVISRAVTKGLDATVPMKDSGVEWLGKVPAHWQVCKLSFRYSVELGKMLDEKRNTGTNQVPYLRNQDVQWGVINIDDLPLIDIGPDELERYTVRLGDLLVCEGGDVGRAAIWRHRDGKIGYQKALHRLRPESPNRDTAEFFFYSLMAAKALGVFEESDTKATISHLPAEKFRQYKFAFPPIDDQQEIAAELGSRLKRSSETISYAENTIALLQERRSVLISAAVTGKIDVRNWQPASGSPSPELAQEAV